MIGLPQTIKAFKGNSPKIFTLYTTMAHLRMLDDYQVYCLVNPFVAEPRTLQHENLPNVLFVNNHQALEFDLCVSFSGGLWGKILEDIAKERNIDCISYEMNYPLDIGSQIRYLTNHKTSFSPSISFAQLIKGSINLIPPYVSPEFRFKVPILNRPNRVCTFGDLLLEKKQETNFDDQHYLFNTIPAQRFGFNPRMGTLAPTIQQWAEILNSVQIYVNTRTFGFYPMEILQAMSCGCIVLSYNYPGIEDFIGPDFVCTNKEECREKLSKLLVNRELLEYTSASNIEKSKLFHNNNGLKMVINHNWAEIHEFGYQQYRI